MKKAKDRVTTQRSRRLRKLRNQALFVLAAGLAVAAYVLINDSFTIYDYAHLTPRAEYAARAFEPLAEAGGAPGPEEMLPAAENETLILYIDPATANVAVYDKRNGHTWYTCPPGAGDDDAANNYEKGVMRSMVGFRYYDEYKRRFTRWSYADAAENGQFVLESIPNGVRVVYEVGDMSLGLDACPRYLTPERFEERVLSRLEDDDRRFLSRMYFNSREKEGFMEMVGGVRGHVINTNRVIGIYNKIEYTLEELMEDNAFAEYEFELSLDFFTIQLELTLEDDVLSVNLPLYKFKGSENTQLFFVELLKYFGAGEAEETGYLFVPSGSGALIEFSNGKTNEDPYISAVYGPDAMMNQWRPQQVSPVRLPVLGVKKENAAVLAYVENGAGLATVNADIAGKNSSYNTAWFSFLIRDYIQIPLATGADLDVTVVQQDIYEGDVTVKYCFTANEAADYVGMALAYQRKLAERGALTPLAPAENTPFYLDILGAVEKRKFVLGTPYTAMESMTTYRQAGEILDRLNENGVHAVQMRWLGWFNRGVNHDVAKNINWIGVNGNRRDMLALHSRLRADGGGLYPAVNFQMTSYFSKNINPPNEVARDPAGYLAAMSAFMREFLNTMGGSRYESDYFMLISPGVLPFHIDRFLPRYEKIGMDTIALTDLGSLLNKSIYRRNSVDRENSRQIVAEQLARFDGAFNGVMVAGGNEYALSAADHLVEIPVEMDRYYILDHEVPFYQIVVHGYLDYAGTPLNTREVQDARGYLLQLMATGAAPYFMWTHTPTRAMEFTPYEKYYSTQYEIWLNEAAAHYAAYNAVYRDLRTQRITGHAVLSESSSRAVGVTMTEYENGTRVYVNSMPEPFTQGGLYIPARDFYVEGGRP